MCAICGIQSKRLESSIEKAAGFCRGMMAAMRHRGPDDEGMHIDGRHGTVLGHCRLSILDLSPAGRQPLFNEDRSLATVVNGEIYNYRELREALLNQGHRFASQSDSEVIVHVIEEHGKAAWSKLRGMYAAAVYDEKSGSLELARDPLGIKPLYVYEDEDWFAFASEIGAFDVFSVKRAFDEEGVADFLLLGSVPPGRTHRNNVKALRPGEVLERRDGLKHSKWDSIISQFSREAAHASPANPEEMACLLRDSVSKHLASDVPIGIFLSGGIDSGTLAGLASEVSPDRIHTVSVGLPGHSLDESALALQTAELYRTAHTEIKLDRAEFERDLDVFFQHLDLPSIDGFNTFMVSKAARRAGLTVALSGVGGDELFAGYSTFERAPKIATLMRMASMGGSVSRAAAAALIEVRGANASRSRVAEIFRSSPADLRSGYLACRGLFVGKWLESLFLPDARVHARRAQERFFDETAWVTTEKLPDSVGVGGLEFTRYMGSQLLRDTDVMSMAHSLEVRTPLVDIEVARFAFRFLANPVPGDGYPKWVLRHALKRPLPQDVVRRPKQGFVFPWEEWLRGSVCEDFNRRLAQGGVWTRFLDRRKIESWKSDYESGRAHWSYYWALYVLMRFLE